MPLESDPRGTADASGRFIEQAVMSADSEEEGVLLGEFDRILDAPPLRPALDEMVAMDVESDL
ncbi:hypothetical protein [Tychonema sp. LEGE 07203]|uniref:hypothetical protein n=1 Tax=Tychonema sp. LEGE 07203 TaxID=1828671 RepID=UPI001881F4B4|nr:hypothetical protein [Tychonema sp. LEGE 07203]MBE9094199.1 hypothetical protein [Tychonema sp. LEGE 07203]